MQQSLSRLRCPRSFLLVVRISRTRWGHSSLLAHHNSVTLQTLQRRHGTSLVSKSCPYPLLLKARTQGVCVCVRRFYKSFPQILSIKVLYKFSAARGKVSVWWWCLHDTPSTGFPLRNTLYILYGTSPELHSATTLRLSLLDGRSADFIEKEVEYVVRPDETVSQANGTGTRRFKLAMPRLVMQFSEIQCSLKVNESQQPLYFWFHGVHYVLDNSMSQIIYTASTNLGQFKILG